MLTFVNTSDNLNSEIKKGFEMSNIDESKLTKLEVRFLNKLKFKYSYIANKLNQSKDCYEGRRFRPDFVLPLDGHDRYKGVVVECQGGIYQQSKTGHSTGKKLSRDYEKCTLAQLNGYFFLQIGSTNAEIECAIEVLDKLYMQSQAGDLI